MYIKKSDELEEMVMKVLHLASEESDHPDLRDRGYIYWRMLSTDPTATKDVILIKRPAYTEDLTNLMSGEVRELFEDHGIEKKESKLKDIEISAAQGDQEAADDDEIEEDEKQEVSEEKSKKKKKDKKDKKAKKNKKKEDDDEVEEQKEETVSTQKASSDLDDIFGFGLSDEPAPTNDAGSDPLADIFGPSSASNGPGSDASSPAPAWDNDIFGGSAGSSAGSVSDASTFVRPKWAEALSSGTQGQAGKSGLRINGRFYRDGSNIKLELEISNNTGSMASDFEMMFNKNSFGLAADSMNVVPISNGNTYSTTVT
jgi:AP-1 complex subunit beta-1